MPSCHPQVTEASLLQLLGQWGEKGSSPVSKGFIRLDHLKGSWQSPHCTVQMPAQLAFALLYEPENQPGLWRWLTAWITEQRMASRRKHQGKDRGHEDLIKAGDVTSLNLDGGWGHETVVLRTIVMGSGTLMACEDWERKMGQDWLKVFQSRQLDFKQKNKFWERIMNLV